MTEAADAAYLTEEDVSSFIPMASVDVRALHGEKKKVQNPRCHTNEKRKKSPNKIFDKDIKGRLLMRRVAPEEPPITYSVLSTKEKSPETRLYFRQKDIVHSVTPGPGSYVPKDVAARSGPRFAKPLKEKTMPCFFTKNDAPGPGAYAMSSGMGKGSAFSIAPKLGMTTHKSFKTPNPGPATYNIRGSMGISNSRGLACTISGRPSRRQTALDSVPGPGAYNPTASNYISKGLAFSSKRASNTMHDGPGPGSYNYPLEMGRKQGTVTIKGRTPLFIPQKGQGPPPTNYNVAPPAKEPPVKRSRAV